MNASRSIYAAILIAIFLTTGTALGAENGKRKGKIPDAQALIDKCWAISLKKRSSPAIADIVNGHHDTLDCLERVIEEQFKLYPENLLAPGEVKKKLRNLQRSAGKLYSLIYNENPGCMPTCGTMYHTFHLGELARILEHMIHVMIGRRKEYKF
jgi:hypothetical protein